jgi:hypothetical protein
MKLFNTFYYAFYGIFFLSQLSNLKLYAFFLLLIQMIILFVSYPLLTSMAYGI